MRQAVGSQMAGLALPSQLRHLIRAEGRDLHAEFQTLLPFRARRISVQRWSAGRLGLLLADCRRSRRARQGLVLRAGQQQHDHHSARNRQHGLPPAGAALAAGPVGAVRIDGPVPATAAGRVDARHRHLRHSRRDSAASQHTSNATLPTFPGRLRRSRSHLVNRVPAGASPPNSARPATPGPDWPTKRTPSSISPPATASTRSFMRDPTDDSTSTQNRPHSQALTSA